jgi:hypothetical protein
VQFSLNRSGALAAIVLAATLCGCANPEAFDANERWFAKSFDWGGTNGGYTFSELKETNESKRPITANDLVSANGACPPPSGPAVPAPAPVAGQPGAIAPDSAAPSLLGGGIALGMTECEVVWRAGAPASVQIGSNPSGGRSAVLTFNGGPRPGVYHFEGGRLADMDRVDVPAVAPKVARRTGKEPVHAAAERVTTE